MTKITLLSPETEKRGGWGTYTLELKKNLEARGHLVTLHKVAATLGKRDLYLPLKEDFDRGDLTIACCAYYCPRLNPDIIIAHGTYALWKPYPLGRFLESRAMRNTRVIACSGFTHDRLLQQGIPSEVMIHPIDINRWVYKQRKKADSFISVSRLVNRKGIDLAIRALAKTDFKEYLIVGDGSEIAKLKRLAESLGMADRIKFLGWVPHEELQEYYNRADVYIQPNRITGHKFEGLGISFMEAQACGLPCITTPNGGQASAVLNEKTGYITDNLKNAILDMKTNIPILSKNARRWAEENNWDDYIHKLLV